MSEDSYRTNDRRVVPWLLLGLAVLFGGVYVAGYLLTSDRVPRGTTVSGVDIGGKSPAKARVTLSDGLTDRRREPISVSALGQRSRLEPARAGLDVDVAASVEQAGGGRSWDPARIWDSLTGGDSFEAVVTVDQERLEDALAGFAREVDTPARNGVVDFQGEEVRRRMPRDGQVVDLPAAADAVAGAYLLADSPVELPTVAVEPDITKGDVSEAMQEFANPAVSGPVFVELAEERVVLRPRDFLPALSLPAKDGDLVPKLDGKVLIRRIEPRMKGVALTAEDATVALVNGRPEVIPAKKGVTFDEEELVDGFLEVVSQTSDGRSLRVGTVVAKPEFTTADATKLGVREEVSEFTTYYPHADYRNVNIGRAAELVNETLLKPGEDFSLNGVVGERTAANGFTKGFVISDGIFKEDFGGGVSQVATTTFNAMFFAGLRDIEHKPHSFYIDRYPVGREATVAWPYVDLRFENDTPHGVLIQAVVEPSTPSTSGAITVRMWSTKYWDIIASQSDRYNLSDPATRTLPGDECVPNEGYGGFEIDVYRSFYRTGRDEVERRERFHTTYTPSDTVICTDL
ncbi:VanW family protein [soil metagenome]